jgi:hypothetical protein
MRLRSDNLRNVIVEKLRKLQRIVGFRPVAEHDGNSGENLHSHAMWLNFANARGRVPAIFFYFAKELAVIAQHAGAARDVMIQLDETAIAESILPLWDVSRQNVSMDINSFEHALFLPPPSRRAH